MGNNQEVVQGMTEDCQAMARGNVGHRISTSANSEPLAQTTSDHSCHGPTMAATLIITVTRARQGSRLQRGRS